MDPFLMFHRLKKSKTFWLMIAGLAGIAQQYFSGAIDGQTTTVAVLGLLYGIFNRDSQAKTGRVG